MKQILSTSSATPGAQDPEGSAPFQDCQRFPGKQLSLFIRRGFLDAETFAQLIARIDANRRTSTIADANGDPLNRTSETCDLFGGDPIVDRVNSALNALAGVPASHGEVLQGQRYAIGQEFKLHTDFFEPGGPDYQSYCAVAGQRTWTLMVYLNRPDEGGATRFKLIDKTIQAEAGKLLAWSTSIRPASRTTTPCTRG